MTRRYNNRRGPVRRLPPREYRTAYPRRDRPYRRSYDYEDDYDWDYPRRRNNRDRRGNGSRRNGINIFRLKAENET